MGNIRDYMGLPDTSIKSIGEIYPIKILDWEKFTRLAGVYFAISYEYLKNKEKIEDKNVKVFDYIMALVLRGSGDCDTMLLELQELFSLILRKKVVFYNGGKSLDDLAFVVEETGKRINRHNFDALKDVVFRQNLLFDRIYAPNEFSQKHIDMAIQALSKEGYPSDVETMLVYVSNAKCMKPIEFVDYTYYQLRADCEIESRKEMNRDINLFRSQGSNAQPVNMFEELKMHKNPYGKEALFKKVDKNDRIENMMKN